MTRPLAVVGAWSCQLSMTRAPLTNSRAPSSLVRAKVYSPVTGGARLPVHFADHSLALTPGAGDDEWLEAIARAAARVAKVGGLVVSLGVDAAAGDPESPLRVGEAGFEQAGRILGALGLPTVLVQEGGYDLATLGPLVRALLLGFEAGRG